MMFRAAMCLSCDNIMKVDSTSETIYCTRCGSQFDAEDAFVFYELKTKGETDVSRLDGYNMLLRCGMVFLEQKKHDMADACFQKILDKHPDDCQAWKLRALAWESKIVNEFRKTFYTYDYGRRELVENKEYLDKYKEYCQNAVRCSPADMSAGLAEEFNDRIRGHFGLAMKALKKERRRMAAVLSSATLILFVLVTMAFRSCGVA
jgi:tetratricopeptide (TPR) repeat protein